MGFFDKIFKSEQDIAKEEIKKVPWHEIEEMSTLDEMVETSMKQPVAILKHSTSCGISRMVLRQFEQNYDLEGEQLKLYYLDLLRHRDISNKIASRFNVPHESPQLIVLMEGKVVYDASHGEIKPDKLEEFVE